MKSLLLTTLALALAFASPNLASAGNGKGGGNKNGGSFNIGKYLGNGSNSNQNRNYNGGNRNRNQSCHNNNYNGGGYLNNGNYDVTGQGYEPFHSYYVCQPGDTFYEVALKEYGSSAPMQYIARYNRLTTNSALVPGQRLLLPSISRTGVLTASRAPAPENSTNPTPKFAAPQTGATGTPATEVGFDSSEENLPSVSVGSALSLDGVEFGEASGSVRLKLGPVSVPVTVTEWTADSVKIELPAVDLDSTTTASIDVFRADGSVASQSAVKLTPAGTQVVKTP